MNDSIAEVKISRFFETFAKDFSAFSGRIIAQRYSVPYLAVNAEGVMQCLSTPTEIEQYFQGFLDQYKADGVAACTFRELECIQVGNHVYLATVTWQLNDSNGREVLGWRESYNLIFREGELKVAFSADF